MLLLFFHIFVSSVPGWCWLGDTGKQGAAGPPKARFYATHQHMLACIEYYYWYDVASVDDTDTDVLVPGDWTADCMSRLVRNETRTGGKMVLAYFNLSAAYLLVLF